MKSLIENNVYWGEFPENEMDIINQYLADNNYQTAKNKIEELGRTEFIFGQLRSDFIYYLNNATGTTCLDCGCGLGAHSFNMARFGVQVHGFDLSKKRVEFCEYRKKIEGVNNLEFYHTDFFNLPFADNFFDSVLMNGVVEWLGEINKNKKPRADQIEILKIVYNKLKTGGKLYVGIENRFAFAYLRGYDHNGIRLTNYYPRFLADWITRIIKKKPYRTYTYSVFGYKRLLRDAGFELNKIKFYLALPSYNYPRYLVDFQDLSAIRFLLNNMTKNKGQYGKLIRLVARFDWCLKILKHFFFSYAIFAEK